MLSVQPLSGGTGQAPQESAEEGKWNLHVSAFVPEPGRMVFHRHLVPLEHGQRSSQHRKLLSL